MWPFSRRDYARGAVRVSRVQLQEILGGFGIPFVRLRDEAYLLLEEETLKDLVHEYHNFHQFVYHGNGQSFPDCDDSARIAVGQVLEGQILAGLSEPVAFGSVVYSRASGGVHMDCLGVTSEKRGAIYNSQARKWHKGTSDAAKFIEAEF